MSVKRYEWVACDEHSCHCDVVESAEGDMVDYEDYAALEARCAALAEEVQAVKALARSWANATDDRLFEEHGEIFHDSIDACEEELKVICPATDAFLAEVRAQGVEMLNTQFKKCTGMLYADSVVSTAEHFADQLRKGVQS
ncbi:hypothetical protein [Enterobacter cloacae]|uniref:hypothetical protein n=1 Tax=Enterobacter cloacae TaxID=550 RepID=UPI00197EA58F|nr:hypothetical protein [Enterobacter cloacae]MBN4791569.1 hypothetical protein [Enterobacter cloacae]